MSHYFEITYVHKSVGSSPVEAVSKAYDMLYGAGSTDGTIASLRVRRITEQEGIERRCE